MPYSKPFRELSDLVLELEALGLAVPDKADAESFLRKVGYYRSGGYRYVLRELLPQAQRNPAARTLPAEVMQLVLHAHAAIMRSQLPQ